MYLCWIIDLVALGCLLVGSITQRWWISTSLELPGIKVASLRTGYYFIQHVFFSPSDAIHCPYQERWWYHIPPLFFFVRMSYVAYLFIMAYLWVKEEFWRPRASLGPEKRKKNNAMMCTIPPNQTYHTLCPKVFTCIYNVCVIIYRTMESTFQ